MWNNSGWRQETGWYKNASAAAPFVGPGDIVSGAGAWFGVRAYNAAYATGSNPSVTLVDQAGANSIVINILSTGFIDVASITTWVAAHTVTTIKVTKFWDQTGNGNHVVQATLGFMPVLALSSLNGLPALQFTNANTTFLDPVQALGATAVTVSTVAKRTGSFTTASFFASDSGTALGVGFGSSANTSMAAFATQNTAAATDNSWHSIQGVGSTTVGALNTDGSDSGNINTGSSAIISPRLGASGAGTVVDGLLVEAGYWTAAMNSTQRGNISTNQHSATSGYNF